jgi:ABC-type multidrug transport system ATPase subunit
MLEIRDLSLFVRSRGEVTPLLADISTRFPRSHFAAIIGPSGCGKSTLLKAIAGIAPGDEEGEVFWQGRNLEEEDFAPSEVGYVPQFSIAYPELTVTESIDYALRLRVGGLGAAQREDLIPSLLAEVGLENFPDHRVAVLSGGQQRRLSLAMEIASRPHILLCDEVTSGLDPQSEDEIVRLLHQLASTDQRLILSVTHSLEHLDLYDSVLVLTGGVLAYHGPSELLTHYFQVDSPNELYRQLALRSPAEWGRSWRKHQTPFLEQIQATPPAPPQLPPAAPAIPPRLWEIPPAVALGKSEQSEPSTPPPLPDFPPSQEPPPNSFPALPPNASLQFLALVERRFLIFLRNPVQLALQAALLLGFPILVAIFAWNGLPNIKNLEMGLDQSVVQQLLDAREFLVQATRVGSLVSGLVMFQVILLTLMGANNSGREIASERLQFEKEKLAGLRPASYLAAKVTFLSILVLAQSIWMGTFVHLVCGLPGDLFQQIVLLTLVNGAMTAICLGFSAWLQSAEQSSLASIYLVGFQLPLSGAVLALPQPLDLITRPFISAYWSWSGILQTMRSERYYDIVQMVAQTTLSPLHLCLAVLTFHLLAGITLAYLGCRRSRWSN